MKNLQKLVNKCFDELDAIGISYGNITKFSLITRGHQKLGACRKESDSNFSIRISKRLLEDNISDIAVKNTIIHEILYSCENCITHKGQWKYFAKKVNL